MELIATVLTRCTSYWIETIATRTDLVATRCEPIATRVGLVAIEQKSIKIRVGAFSYTKCTHVHYKKHYIDTYYSVILQLSVE
jgi:hypothetical protein